MSATTSDLLPSIVVLGTGGTISTSVEDRLELVDYSSTGVRSSAEQVVASVPEVAQLARVTALDPLSVSSLALTFEDWRSVAEEIERQSEDSAAISGFLVLCGTASLEEFAYFLQLTLAVPPPVVVVGALRPLNALSSDAQMNLLNAVRVAIAPSTREAGVLVASNDRIHDPRDVVKAGHHRVDAFQSPTFGPLGYIDPDGTVVIGRVPTHQRCPTPPFPLNSLPSELPRVDIAMSYAGGDGTAIRAFGAAGAAGIVCAGFGGGRMTPAEVAAAHDLAQQGVLIVQSSRSFGGRVLPRVEAAEERFVQADDLSPQKARVLSTLILTRERNRAEIERLLSEC
jgi:L-asparaginase